MSLRETDEEEERAWRALPKLELFARELRPGWHSAGNEVLRFQHSSFWAPPHSSEENDS